MSFFGRLGSEQMKFQIDFSIGKVETTSCSEPVLVRVTRGSKVVKSPVVSGRSGNYDFGNRTLSLSCTLYRKRDKWLPKGAELTVVRCKGSERPFGRVTVDLARYVDMTERTVTETWPLEKCEDKRAKITVKLHSKWLKGAAAAAVHDDDASTSQMAPSRNDEEAQNIDDFIGGADKHAEDSQHHQPDDDNGDEPVDEDFEDEPPQPQRRVSLQQQRAADRTKRDVLENKEATNPRAAPANEAQRRRQQLVDDEPSEEDEPADEEHADPQHEDNDGGEEELLARIAIRRANQSQHAAVMQRAQTLQHPQQRRPQIAANRRLPQPRAHHWRETDDDDDGEAKEASESDEIFDDEDGEESAEDLSEDPNRRVKFGPAQRKSSTDKPQSPHHTAVNQPAKSNLKQASPRTIGAADSSASIVVPNTHSSPTTTPPAPSTPSSSRSSPRASIIALTKSVKPIGPSAIFSCSLLQAMTLNPRASSLDVPYIFDVLIQALERSNGLTTEGIFRLSANAPKVTALKQHLESGNYKITITDPHVIANVLKQWLMAVNQHEPIIPLPLHTQCLTIGQIDLDHREPQPAMVQSELQKICPQLPLLTQRLLMRLFEFIVKLGSAPYVTQNRMNVHALSVVFAPSILSIQADNHADGFEIFNRAKHAVRFVEHLVDHRQLIDQSAGDSDASLTSTPSQQAMVTSTTISVNQPLSFAAAAQRSLPIGAVATPLTAAVLQARNNKVNQAPATAKTVTTIPVTSPPRGQRPPPRASAAIIHDGDDHDDSGEEAVLIDSEEEFIDDSESSAAVNSAADDRSESESPVRPPPMPRANSKQQAISQPAIVSTIKRLGEDALVTTHAVTHPATVGRRFPIARGVSESDRSEEEELDGEEEEAKQEQSEEEEVQIRRPQPQRQPSTANSRTPAPPRPSHNPLSKPQSLAPPRRSAQSGSKANPNVFDDKSDEELLSDDSSASNQPPVIHEHHDDTQEDQPPQRKSPPLLTQSQSPQLAPVSAPSMFTAAQARLEQQALELQAVRATVARYEDLIGRYKSAEAQRALDEEAAVHRRESDAKEREAIREQEVLRRKQEKELKSTQSELETVKKQLEAANSLIAKRNTELVETKQNSRSVDELKAKDQQIAGLAAKLEAAESQLTESTHSNDDQLRKLHDHIEALERELESQRAIMVKQRGEVDQYNATIEEINRENEELQHALEQTEERLSEAEERVKQAVQVAAAATAAAPVVTTSAEDPAPESDSEYELYEDDPEEVLELKQRVMKLKKLMRKKNDELKRMKRAALTIASPAGSAAGSVPSSPAPQSPRVDHSECQRALRSVEAKLDNQSKELDSLHQQLQRAEHECRALSDRSDELDRQLKQKELHVSELIGQVKELKSKTKAAPPPPPPPPAASMAMKDREELSRLREESQQTQSQLLSLEQQLAAKDERIAEYERRLAKYAESIRSMESEALRLRQLNDNIAVKMTDIEHRTDEAITLRAQLNSVTEQLQSMQEEKRMLERDLVTARSKTNSPLISPAAISSVTAQRELTKTKESLEQLKLKWETLKIDSRARVERERKQRETIEEQFLTVQEENELLRQRQENNEELNKLIEAALSQSSSSKLRSSKGNAAQLQSLLTAANHRIQFLETHVQSCDEILKTAKQSWSQSSELVETEMARMQAEIDTQRVLLAQATEGKPVEYAQLELLHKKLLRSERAREQLQRDLDAMEARIAKANSEAERALSDAKQQRADNELLKQDLVKQGIALKTIADDNFELKEWLRLNTKGKPVGQA